MNPIPLTISFCVTPPSVLGALTYRTGEKETKWEGHLKYKMMTTTCIMTRSKRMQLVISLLSLSLLFFSLRGGSIQAAGPDRNRNNDKHSVDSLQHVEQFVAPSLYETVQLAFNLTVWGLSYAGTALEMVKDWGGLGG